MKINTKFYERLDKYQNILLTGCRQCGKTTILVDWIKYLLTQKEGTKILLIVMDARNKQEFENRLRSINNGDIKIVSEKSNMHEYIGSNYDYVFMEEPLFIKNDDIWHTPILEQKHVVLFSWQPLFTTSQINDFLTMIEGWADAELHMYLTINNQVMFAGTTPTEKKCRSLK